MRIDNQFWRPTRQSASLQWTTLARVYSVVWCRPRATLHLRQLHLAGAGVLALAHGGKHNSKEAIASGEWILKHDFKDYNDDTPVYGRRWSPDRYHYGGVLCSQAMFQLGGKYWEQFFPPFATTLLENQQADGAWPPERYDKQFGSCYSTSLCILSLSVPNQMLPIFQR